MRWGAIGCFLLGCGFDPSGLGGGSPEAAAESNDEPDPLETSTTGEAEQEPELDDDEDSGQPASTGPDEPGSTDAGTSSDSGGSSSTGDEAGFESCAAVLLDDPRAADGVYVLDTPGGTVDAYCDMTTDGGGWTLVARSTPTDPGPAGFGWSVARGDLDELDAPYSLGPLALGMSITEILVGDRGEGMQWGAHVYRMQVPPEFDDAMDESSTSPQTITTIVGDCAPTGGPEMLRRLGYTARDDLFFFRDDPGFAEYGLMPTGFDTYWEVLYRCSRGADLYGDQGMIFVR